ncbi:MAG: TonB-dependent receptor [Xanthomonadales bacterium]|nr:TonB-dependent receptor [Xanthomonadales bacterium]
MNHPEMTPQRWLLCALLCTVACLFAGPVLAQDITSDIRVVVSDPSGTRVEGVDVRITHVPTLRSQTIATNALGLATARGLQIGGPYRVESASSDYTAEAINNIYLELGDTSVIDLAVRAAAAGAVEEVVVLGQQGRQELRYGVGSDFQEDFIESIPSISRDFVSTLATDPQVLVDTSVARGPAVSIAGGNYRFNSVTIDGVAQNDNFGLSKNASATQRSPISIDAIEALSVNVAPFDVTYGNFVGGNINVVTKSGTNEFHGSVYAFQTDDGWSGNKSKGQNLGIQAFSEDVYGGTFGGPIIKDKLFFFAAYEKFETDRPSNTQSIDDIFGVSQADVDRARSIFMNEYGFDPGPFATTDTDQDEKILLKLDWYINDAHRAVISYQSADGDVLFDDFPEAAILQSNRYNINETLDAYSVHLFSDWNDRLSTEFKFGKKEVENRQISAGVGPQTPDFAIFTAGGGLIGAGGDRFRHTNELDNESTQFKFKADYELGEHTLTAGWEQEEYTVRNAFLPFSKGQYLFSTLDNLEDRIVDFVLYGNSNSGVAIDAESNFSLTVDSFYIQDEFAASDDLTLKFGLRYDTYSNSDMIPENPAFLARRGFSNNENLDGKDLISPRFGFNWTPTDRLTVRGGAGLFGGGTPLIMLSNSYAGNGVTRTFAAFLAPFFGPPVSDSIAAAVADLPDPTAAFDNFQQYIGFNPVGDVDAIDPNFDVLSTWKYNLGFDYDTDLWFLGDGWRISGEWVHTEVKNGYDIDELNRTQVGTAPDGRPIYDFPAGGDYVVTNTSEGGGDVYSLRLANSWDTDHGLFDLDVGWTHQDLDEVRSYNRFVGFETYAMDPQTDLNNPVLGPSRYQTEDRITATFNWQKQLFGDNTTAVTLFYTGRSGLLYTPVFGSANAAFGGTFLADFGSEADNPGSQLFYVPTGMSDPLVTGDPAFLQSLNTYIDSFDCLRSQRGQVAGRNSCENGWVNLWNLRFLQEFKLKGEHALELSLDIENLGNLINDDWGRVANFTAPSNIALANVAISDNGSQYIYTPVQPITSSDDLAPNPAVARLPSVYRIQLGLRYRF